MLLATPAARIRLGLFRRPAYDPDLRAGRLADAQNGRFTWEPKENANPFSAEYLRRPEQHAMIEKALTEAAGAECVFVIGERSAAAQPTRPDDGLKEIYETFGAGNVIVQEN